MTDQELDAIKQRAHAQGYAVFRAPTAELVPSGPPPRPTPEADEYIVRRERPIEGESPVHRILTLEELTRFLDSLEA